jgi:hypothetical protein
MIARTAPEVQGILKQNGLVLDILAGAIKKEHTGKRLLHKMIICSEFLGKKQGYKYGFSFITNFKAGIALQKLNY